MMPKDRARRRAIRSTAVGVAALGLVLLTAVGWGPLGGPSAGGPSSGGGVAAAAGSTSLGAAAGPSSAPLSVDAAGSAEPAPTPTPSPDPAVLAAQLQGTLDRVRSRLSIPGVSVAILWDDGRSWLGASGLRNVSGRIPMTSGTAFAFASVSKTMTAAVVLQLVEEGRLGLDQPVAPLLPKFGLDRRITVRMLLDHTSGLPDFFFGKGIDAALLASPGATWTAARSWKYVPTPHATPGTKWMYSNTNYLLLGELVRAVTGHLLAQEIRSRLLDPLGLSGAYYQAFERPREAGTLAYRLLRNADGTWRARLVAPASGVIPFRSVVTAAGGAGSMAGTALDAARWMRAWAGGAVLGPALQAEVFLDIERTVQLHARIPYGLGIQRVTLVGHVAYGHSGQYLGVRNVVRYLPDLGLTIAVMTNQSYWDPNRIAGALVNVIAPPPPPTPTPSPSASPSPSPSPTASPSS